DLASSDAPKDVASDGGTTTDAPASDAPAAETGTSDAGGLNPLQARGKYLVDAVIACGDCHTPQGPTGPVAGMYLAGNANFIVTPGGNLPSRNLTNDATGLKHRSDAEIQAMVH